jgi:hypothetical protein
MLSLLVTVLIMCIVFGLLWWIFTLIPLPPPFAQIGRVVIVVIFCLWLIYLLLGLVGGGAGFGIGHPLVR